MTKKYALIRKSNKIVGEKKERKWAMCHIYNPGSGRLIAGGFTEDRTIVENTLSHMQKSFPEEKYAILEMEE